MANTKYNHVWVVDTASAAVETEAVCITGLRWVGTVAGAGGVTLTDLDPKLSAPVIWEAAVGAAATLSEESGMELKLFLPNGFGVPTLLAGSKLYVYLSQVGFR